MNKARVAKTKAVTAALLAGAYPELPKLTDEKSLELIKLVKKGGAFGAGTSAVADNATKQALALMLDVDPEYLGKRSLLVFDPFVAMVPTEDNGDLRKGQVYVLMDSRQNSYFICSDGSTMSTKMSTSRKKVEPANADQIDGFYAELDLFTV